ncbi:hypothetical protein [Ottowia cancrivicina]|jgi:hypothetical protein|uniref:Uncharacterized protein n=1 Tax=Ottowia cancrivicina TaxID=3040346 RepID=A0AAW6RLF0_9BURK|nr:hypothetical protein [Ottowia sp. 10c7w1]MDG9699386.1 hypothetical protein [Ottowia sp. 10c7w1]
MLYHGCHIMALKQEPIENLEHQVFSRPIPFTKRKLKMKNICLAAIGLISFMLHFNLTIVAFMKSSAIYADEKTILWRSVLEYLSIPIGYIDGYLFIDNVIVLIMLNSLIWTCLIVFVIWRLTMFKKT